VDIGDGTKKQRLQKLRKARKSGKRWANFMQRFSLLKNATRRQQKAQRRSISAAARGAV